LILPFGFDGVLARSLIIGLAMPTAVNTIIIAREMNNEPDYMAQLVLVSTALSPLTITAWLLFLGT
jgi:predicted permease